MHLLSAFPAVFYILVHDYVLFCMLKIRDKLFHFLQQTVHLAVIRIIIKRIVHLLHNLAEHFAEGLDPLLSVAVLYSR